jgi:hypothetical protein
MEKRRMMNRNNGGGTMLSGNNVIYQLTSETHKLLGPAVTTLEPLLRGSIRLTGDSLEALKRNSQNFSTAHHAADSKVVSTFSSSSSSSSSSIRQGLLSSPNDNRGKGLNRLPTSPYPLTSLRGYYHLEAHPNGPNHNYDRLHNRNLNRLETNRKYVVDSSNRRRHHHHHHHYYYYYYYDDDLRRTMDDVAFHEEQEELFIYSNVTLEWRMNISIHSFTKYVFSHMIATDVVSRTSMFKLIICNNAPPNLNTYALSAKIFVIEHDPMHRYHREVFNKRVWISAEQSVTYHLTLTNCNTVYVQLHSLALLSTTPVFVQLLAIHCESATKQVLHVFDHLTDGEHCDPMKNDTAQEAVPLISNDSEQYAYHPAPPPPPSTTTTPPPLQEQDYPFTMVPISSSYSSSSSSDLLLSIHAVDQLDDDEIRKNSNNNVPLEREPLHILSMAETDFDPLSSYVDNDKSDDTSFYSIGSSSVSRCVSMPNLLTKSKSSNKRQEAISIAGESDSDTDCTDDAGTSDVEEFCDKTEENNNASIELEIYTNLNRPIQFIENHFTNK